MSRRTGLITHLLSAPARNDLFHEAPFALELQFKARTARMPSLVAPVGARCEYLCMVVRCEARMCQFLPKFGQDSTIMAISAYRAGGCLRSCLHQHSDKSHVHRWTEDVSRPNSHPDSTCGATPFRSRSVRPARQASTIPRAFGANRCNVRAAWWCGAPCNVGMHHHLCSQVNVPFARFFVL
jgi:hypothetical protein